MLDKDSDTKVPHEMDETLKNRPLDPRFFSFEELEGLGHPKQPINAIRAKCIDCCMGSLGEVRKCQITSCALYPMRMGHNPFHAKSNHSKNKKVAPARSHKNG